MALVEAQDLQKLRSWKPAPDRYSNRCSSLTPASARFLDRIGAWGHVRRDRVQPYHEMQVWDGVSGARIEFDYRQTAPLSWPWPLPWSSPPGGGEAAGRVGGGEEGGGNTIAYMIENLNLTSALLGRLDELGGDTTIFDGARVESITLGEETEELDLREWPIVHVAGGQRPLAARLLVGADGANSPVRAFAGIPSRGWDYERHGVVATLQLEGGGGGGVGAGADDAGKVAYQRFLPTGPVAMLPLPGNLATLVWSTTPANAALLRRLPARDLVALVNGAFRLDPVDLRYMHTMASGQADEVAWRLERQRQQQQPAPLLPRAVAGVQEGSVASFPLRMRHADAYAGERVALAGDAAHTVHPLAGQGLNQGQGDAEALARALARAAAHGADVGARAASLAAYAADRYAANHALLGVCDKLHRLYSVGSGPLVPLRSLGLAALDAMPPLKRLLMDQAAGNGAKLF